MLDWLKTILGDAYTEDIEKKIAEEIGKGFVARNDFNATKKELEAARETVKGHAAQLETLKKSSGDAEALQKQISELQKQNAAQAEAHAAEVKSLRLNSAVDSALQAAKAKNNTAARALLADFLEKAEVSEDGKVKGLDTELKKLVEGANTSFLFAVDQTAPTITGASPAGSPTAPVDPKLTGFETRLAEARKIGDNVSVVAIKQEAAAAGFVLL